MTDWARAADVFAREAMKGPITEWRASSGDIFRASRDMALYVDNTLAAEAAHQEAYDRRIERIEKSAGVRLVNPYAEEQLVNSRKPALIGERKARLEELKADFARRVDEIGAGSPDIAGEIGAGTAIEEEAKTIAREAVERFEQATASRPGAGKYLPILGGAMWGATRDPLQWAALVMGGGGGAARTVAGRVLATAGREAAANAGAEALLQGVQQGWRAEAGVETGLGPAVRSIGVAGAFGAVFGGAGRGLVEGFEAAGRAASRRSGRAGTAAAGAEAVADGVPVDRATSLPSLGDQPPAALLESSAPIPPRSGLERGAARALEAEDAMRLVRPTNIDERLHETLATTALGIVEGDPAAAARFARAAAAAPEAVDVPLGQDAGGARIAPYVDDAIYWGGAPGRVSIDPATSDVAGLADAYGAANAARQAYSAMKRELENGPVLDRAGFDAVMGRFGRAVKDMEIAEIDADLVAWRGGRPDLQYRATDYRLAARGADDAAIVREMEAGRAAVAARADEPVPDAAIYELYRAQRARRPQAGMAQLSEEAHRPVAVAGEPEIPAPDDLEAAIPAAPAIDDEGHVLGRQTSVGEAMKEAGRRADIAAIVEACKVTA